MIVFVQIDPTTGNGLGPNFVVTADVGTVSPGVSTRTDLLNGVYFTVSNSAQKIKLTSQGNCTNSIEVAITNIPPTTTTTTKSCSFNNAANATFIIPPPTTSTSSTSTSTSSTSSTSTSSTSSTSSSSTTSTSTTSTTTAAPSINATFTILPVNLDGTIIVEVFRNSGTNPNNLFFNGTVTQYNDASCVNVAANYSFSVLLPANSSTAFVTIPTVNPLLPSIRIITLTVGGVSVSASPGTINVGGTLYTINGLNQCVLI